MLLEPRQAAVEDDGHDQGEGPLHGGLVLMAFDVAVPGPSGRLAVILRARLGHRTTDVGVVDLGTGKERRLDLGARPRDPVWSPSGRQLAVPTDQGTVVLVDADPSAAAAAPAAPADGGGWTELRTSERFWRARAVGDTVELHHGYLGAAGTRGSIACSDGAAARKELERRIQEKTRGGYRRSS